MPNVTIETLIIAILATWRISSMIYYEYGPWDIFLKIREAAGVQFTDETGRPLSFWGKQLKCFWCITFYVAFIVWPVTVYVSWALVPFALSGGALLLSQSGRIIWHEMTDIKKGN